MAQSNALLILLLFAGLGDATLYSFSQCEANVRGILNDTLTLDGISNETIDQYIYHGSVTGLNADYPRSQYLALTYHGCKTICGSYVELNDAPTALNIAANWVFPLAILLSLPYDSLHRRKYRKTLESLSNWLGSPQTALTATMFNFLEIGSCQKRVVAARRQQGQPVRGSSRNNVCPTAACDAFYILSCLNQFELPPNEYHRRKFLEVLIYGLFRPMTAAPNGEDRSPAPTLEYPFNEEEARYPDDAVLLRELASTMAFQLRMLRRRGVIPTLGSLATFLTAFVFSVVLAFDDLGDRTTAHSLAIGLLFSWLPLLIIFTIVDRNPSSADRSAELMSRWLYNVNAIMDTQVVENGCQRPNVRWWRPSPAGSCPPALRVGHFVGQGRKMEYCGLVSAVIMGSESHDFDGSLECFLKCANRVEASLEGPRPTSWYVTAVVAQLLVGCEMMMGFAIAYATPTVGLGCRSFLYLLTYLMSSISWTIHLRWKRTPRWAKIVSHSSNGFTIFLWVAIIGFQLTGAMNNCFCSSSLFSFPSHGGYMDFENAQFYKVHFDVETYWALATIIGGLVPVVVFLVAIVWWSRCKSLWRSDEREEPRVWHGPQADMNWLR